MTPKLSNPSTQYRTSEEEKKLSQPCHQPAVTHPPPPSIQTITHNQKIPTKIPNTP
ncbi:hypothetical protein L873DRAFT_1815808 [Choiromyces venosus 120613-1]|uniref:Uncharacterized protein n=1 Tax=Choiromyces venosus 120613-1 TaxID=1336337 RepID=A0A3N4J5A3_9PEZI|nr:hypothetical protein L873DRAFT_1815808 [Choiromyces venosus 120613-1]